MNKIGLVDVDGHNFPNLPLMKLSAYHKARGDTVEWAVGLEPERYDRLYMAKVFTFTPDDDTVYNADEIVKGGTGYGLDNKLPDEIEHIYPDYSLYPQYPEAYGFLTRGCPRNCPFCIVSAKEGCRSVQVAELSEFWRGQHTVKLLDPNLLACENCEEILQSLINSGAWVDFTQGLDIRLTDKYIAAMINNMRVKMLHFSWDYVDDDSMIYTERKLREFKQHTNLDYRKLGVYVLTNFNSTHEQDLYRLYKLREIGYDPYVMVFGRETAPRQTRLLQRWANNKWVWRKCERFEDYDPSMAK